MCEVLPPCHPPKFETCTRGNGPPEGKFMELGGKVNFGVLNSKIDVIPAKKRAISLVLTNKASFSCQQFFLRFNVCIQIQRVQVLQFNVISPWHGNRTKIQINFSDR